MSEDTDELERGEEEVFEEETDESEGIARPEPSNVSYDR